MSSVQLDIFGNPVPSSSVPKEKKRVVFSNEQVTVKIKEEKIILPIIEPQVIEVKKEEIVIKKKGKRGRKSYNETYADVDLIDVPNDEELKKKLYYSISEVSAWFKLTNSQIRFWENEFDILKPRKNRKGDRLFRIEDIHNLKIIYYLLRNRKFSIEGAKEYLKANKHKTDSQLQLKESLTRFKTFLLEIKINLDK